MISTWMLVIWLHAPPPIKPEILPPQPFDSSAACEIEGKKEAARLGQKYLWFCIELVEPKPRRREAWQR